MITIPEPPAPDAPDTLPPPSVVYLAPPPPPLPVFTVPATAIDDKFAPLPPPPDPPLPYWPPPT